MNQRFRFNYTDRTGVGHTLLPQLNLTLHLGSISAGVTGLLDSGSSVNVLPYWLGVGLSAVWEEQMLVEPLAGNLKRSEARGLFLEASHPQLTTNEKVRLVFAWTQSQEVPVSFGQVNFFQLFEVCFFGAEKAFENRQRE